MGCWIDWLCCRKTEVRQDEEEDEIVTPSLSSPTSDSNLVTEPNEMGKAISRPLSNIRRYFFPKSSLESTAQVPESVDNRLYEPLASPRSPLIRGIASLTPPDTPVLPPFKRLRSEIAKYLDFPLLMDERTIEYVNRNKLMVIMKGLSGSGKSTLAESIKIVYDSAVVCSADHFFMVDGEYKFDPEKLKDAHASCQKRARQATKRNCPVIVIDNTNVRVWESQEYLQMAKTNNYNVAVLEPQTPWRFDASELAARSTHGLDEEFLNKKLKMYQQALPIYYAWFVNEPDSSIILKIAYQWLERALLEIEDFYKDFSQLTGLDSLEDMLKYFTNNSTTLHLTSKFTMRGKPDGALEYINNPDVKRALTQCYPIHIIGYVITPRTFGARIQLTEEQLELWGQNDYESRPDNLIFGNPSFHNKNETISPPEASAVDGDGEVLEIIDLCEPRVTVSMQQQGKNRFYPTSGKGSRAHLTLGCAYGVKPVTTGFDLIDVVSYEQQIKDKSEKHNENTMDVDSDDQNCSSYDISGAVVKSYGEGQWVMYPESVAVIDSLFSAYY